MTVRDAPTFYLAAISVGLSLPEGSSASVNRPRWCHFCCSVLNNADFELLSGHVSTHACKYCCMGIYVSLPYITVRDKWYQAFPLAFSPPLRDIQARVWK